MIIQTDIFSLLGLALGALFAGAVTSWLFIRCRARVSKDNRDAHEAFLMLFSRLTHRLKTSSEIIKGHLANLGQPRRKDSAQWDVSFNAIEDETKSIDELVQRLELVVRLGMPGNRLIIEPVNIPRLLEDTMVNLAPAADSKGVILGGIVNRANNGNDHVVSGDTLALREIFSIILENAVKHNGKGTEITAEVTKSDNSLQVNIIDNGKGFSEATRNGIFDRGNTQYRPRFHNGTGMGLYLSKLLVEQHGGQIDIETGEAGSKVRILLPLRRNSAALERPRVPAQNTRSEDTHESQL